MTYSLLGPHVIRPTPEAVDWARVAPVVKALDDTTAIRVAEKATVRIFRKYFPVQDVNRNGGSVIDEVLTALGDAPATHVEGFNECFQRLGQGLERYVAFTREAVDYLRVVRPDLTLVAYCFSTGNPEKADWEYLRLFGYGGARCIGLHAYWGNQGFTLWNALRHRMAHAWTNGEHPPFLITEAGRDKVEGGQGGWKADGLTEEAYLAELEAYQAAVLEDRYVIAITPFCGGPTPDWRAFDTDPISGRLAAVTGPLPPHEEPPMATINGIDVSNLQGPIDWAKVAASDVQFAFIKASGDEGPTNTYLDPYFPENWHQARAHGLVRGAYHYVKFSRVSPAASVTTLQRAIQAAGGLAAGDLIAGDFEDPDVPDHTSLHIPVAEWLSLAELVFGVAPGKYSAKYYTSTHDLEHPDLERWWSWWAAYQANLPPASVGWSPIRIWQHSASGTVPGISGQVDLNVFYGTVAELRALGLPAPPHVDWETPVFAPIYQGASAVGGMPDRVAQDEEDAADIIRLMDAMKSRHPVT